MDPLVLTILIGKNPQDFLDERSCEVDMDDRKVNFALVLRSGQEGMSIIFGWGRAEVVKHLVKFSPTSSS